MSNTEIVLSIDTKTIGLCGDAYYVGAILFEMDIDTCTKKELDNIVLLANYNLANGLDYNMQYIKENIVPNIIHEINCESLYEQREKFWTWYTKHKLKYPQMITIADCGFPCEVGFLRACMNDDPKNREKNGPFPLHELGTLLMLCGKDPCESYERIGDELPLHNPISAARQSARLWLEHRKLLKMRL